MKHHKILCLSAMAIALVGPMNLNAQTDPKQDQSENPKSSKEVRPENLDKVVGGTNANPEINRLNHNIDTLRWRNRELRDEMRTLQSFLAHEPSTAAALDNPAWLHQHNRERAIAKYNYQEFKTELAKNEEVIQTLIRERDARLAESAPQKPRTTEEMLAQVMSLLGLWGHEVESIQITFKDGETQTFQNVGFNEDGGNIFSREIEGPKIEEQGESEDLRK